MCNNFVYSDILESQNIKILFGYKLLPGADQRRPEALQLSGLYVV